MYNEDHRQVNGLVNENIILRQLHSIYTIQRYAKEAAKLYCYIEKWLYRNPRYYEMAHKITENIVVKGVKNTETVRNIEIK